MTGIDSARRWALRLATLAWLASGTSALAGDRAQVDLSVSVSMAPATFTPGSQGIFSVSVHNAGPDAAGTVFPDEKPIRVYSSSIVFPPTQPPPLEILSVLTGNCWLDRFSEPLPNGQWVVQFIFYFDPIAAGESRTCTNEVEFSLQANENIPTRWRVVPHNDQETNPDDNQVDYTFVAAQPTPPASVPAGTFPALVWLGLALLLSGGAAARRVASVK